MLENVNFVCTTADIWSAKKRSFLGTTCHWIDDNFERKSVTLACRRFRSPHNYIRIKDLLNEINMEFSLNSTKIVATITDNGSNFVKAFSEFGVQEKNVISINNEWEDASTEEENSSDSE